MQWDKEIKNTIVYEVEKQPGYEKPQQEVTEKNKTDNKDKYSMLGITGLTILIDFTINVLTACVGINKKGGKE